MTQEEYIVERERAERPKQSERILRIEMTLMCI